MGDGSTLSNVGVDGIVSTANATAITIDSNENVGIGVTPEISTNTTGLYVGSRTAVVNWGNGSYFPHNAYESSSSWKYRDTAAAGIYSRNNNGDHVFEVAPSGTADAAISFTTGFEVLNDGKARAPNGLLFGSDTSANNALDDYEEGTFTPVLSDGTNNASHNSQVGNYIKIGKSVQCRIYIAIGSLGSIPANYDLRITGLPFTSSTENSRGVCVFGNLPGGNLPTGTTPVGYVESYTTFMYLRCFDGARESTLRADEWSADGSAIINVMYQAQT